MTRRGQKPIYDVDASYVFLKQSVLNNMKQLYPKAVTGADTHLIPTDKALAWIETNILFKEEEAQAKGSPLTYTDRYELSKELKKQALDLFSPQKTSLGSKLPDPSSNSLSELVTKGRGKEASIDLKREEEAARQAILDTTVPNFTGAPNAGGGEMTLGQYIDTLSSNIKKAGKDEFATLRFTTITEKELLEQVNKPKILKYIKNVFGEGFTSDVFATIPDKDYNNLVFQIANNFGLVKKIGQGAKNATA